MAVDIGPKISLQGEREFKAQMKSVETVIKANGQELKRLSAEYDRNENAVETLTKKGKTLQSSLDASQGKVKALTSQYIQQSEKLKALKEEMERTEKSQGKNSQAAEKARIAYQRQSSVCTELEGKISSAKYQVSEFTKQIEENARQLAEAESKSIALGNALESAGGMISSTGEKISGVGDKMLVVTGAITAAAGAAVAAFNEVDNGADVVVKKTGAVGRAGEELEAIYKKVIGSIEGVGFSAEQVGGAVGEINTRFDFTGDKLENATKKFLRFARANDIDVVTAIQLVSREMGDAKIPAEEYEDVLDALTVAGQKSGIGVDTLSQNTAKYGSSLRQLGYDVKETTALLAEWEKSGMNVETGIAGMRKAVQYFTKAGKDGKEEFANLIKGIEDGSVTGAEALKIFGAKAGADMVEAIQRGKFSYQDMMDAVNQSKGSLDSTFDGLIDGSDKTQQVLNQTKVAASEFGGTIMTMVTPVIDKANKGLKSVTDRINKMSDAEKEGILKTVGMVAAAGPAVKIIGTATTKVGKLTSGAGKLFKDLGKISAAKKAAKAVGDVGSKAASSVQGVSNLSKGLSKFASPGGVAALAVGAAAAIGVALWKMHKDAVDADISSHFGKIKLSAEEVEDVAKRLTTTKWSMKVSAAVEAVEDIKKAENEIHKSIAEMEKIEWKAKIGLTLTEDEKQKYLDAVRVYAEQATEYAASHGYAIGLSIDATVGKDSQIGKGLTQFTNTYYANAQKDLEQLGKDLADEVNRSFENNTFGDNINTAKILDQMNDIIGKIQDAEYKAALDAMKIKYSATGVGLDQDSYNRLSQQLTEDTMKIIEQSEEAVKRSMSSAYLLQDEMIDAGIAQEFAERVTQDIKAQLEYAAQSQQGEFINVGFGSLFDTLTNNFSQDVDDANKSFKESLKTLFYPGEDGEYDLTWIGDPEKNLPFLNKLTVKGVPERLKKESAQIIEALRPQKTQLQSIRDECLAAGKEVPESVRKGLADLASIGKLSNDIDSMYNIVGEKIANDPALMRATKKAHEAGKAVPEELAKSIAMYAKLPYNAGTKMFEVVEEAVEVSAQEVADTLNAYGETLGKGYADSIAEQYGLIYKNGQYMVEKAADGMKSKQSAFNETAKKVAEGGRDSMQSVMNTNLNPPGMNRPDWTGAAIEGLTQMQAYLDRNPLISGVDTIKGVPGSLLYRHAEGGIFDRPHIALVAEESPGEAIIPLNAARRSDAVEIWQETGRRLGEESYSEAANYGYSRYQTKRSGGSEKGVSRSVNLNEGAIVIYTQASDADEIYDVFKRRLEQDVRREVRASGGT